MLEIKHARASERSAEESDTFPICEWRRTISSFIDAAPLVHRDLVAPPRLTFQVLDIHS